MRTIQSRFSHFACAVVLTAVSAVPAAVFAQTQAAGSVNFADRIQQGVNSAAAPSGFRPSGPTLTDIIGNVIAFALSLVGIVLIVIFLYAGFLWMTAGGDTEKVKTARTMIMNAVIGLMIVAAAYALTRFIVAGITGVSSGAQNVQTAPR